MSLPLIEDEAGCPGTAVVRMSMYMKSKRTNIQHQLKGQLHRPGLLLKNLHIFVGLSCVSCKITYQNKGSCYINKYQRVRSHPHKFASCSDG